MWGSKRFSRGFHVRVIQKAVDVLRNPNTVSKLHLLQSRECCSTPDLGNDFTLR